MHTENRLMTTDKLLPLGTMTVFYVPSHKLDDPRYFNGKETARSAIHEFLMDRFKAYTQTPTPVKGYWVNQDDTLIHDVMERFEVSFNSETEFNRIIEFLIELCKTLSEDSIYVTRGDCSYLVHRPDAERGTEDRP